MQLSLHLPRTNSATAALSQSKVRSRAPSHLHPAAGVVQSATCQFHAGREGQQGGAGGTGRRATILGLTAGGLLAGKGAGAVQSSEETPQPGEVKHSDAEWRKLLSPAAYRVLRQAGTELPLSSPLYREKQPGTYKCAGCGSPLFLSSTKYDSRTGWPSFTEAVDNSVVELLDTSIPFYPRTEVRCKRCGGHIGHVFPDGPPPTGQRYCMNGAALEFEPASSTARNGARPTLKL